MQGFPRTRYQGSKRKLAGAIVEHLGGYEYSTVLDAFGGTGAVSYAFKRAGKQVVYNDILEFNHQVGLALIENDAVRLSAEDLQFVQERDPDIDYDNLIERTYEGIYFTGDENRWLDVVCQNIPRISCPYKRALAWFAVFQAALIKRPFNLFHRSNLYMRQANVERSFGNKSSWDRSFADCLGRFALEGSSSVIDSGHKCKAQCADALTVEGEFDLVYIDTPYIKRNRTGVDYHGFYHFLEGMVRYKEWHRIIDVRFKHLPLRNDQPQPWTNPDASLKAFGRLFERFRKSVLCVSYRSEGIPSVDDLTGLLAQFKRRVTVVNLSRYQYALSPNTRVHETLLIGI